MNRVRVNGFSSVKETVSPEKFLKIVKNNPGVIKNSSFIPPSIGKRNDFGKIEVEYQSGSKR